MYTDKIKIFKKCFKGISISELNDRVSNYRTQVNLRTITDESLRAELLNLFRVEVDGKDLSFFPRSDTQTQPHYRYHFYRIRKFCDRDYQGLKNKCFVSMQKEQDIWTRPETYVTTMGRLNQVNESVLYTAAQPTNAIYETSCNEGDLFFLMVYENIKQMRVSQIHVNPYFSEFDELENTKLTILRDFLLEEFTKIVARGEEYNYKSSVAIYKHFFYNPNIDAFAYPSIKTRLNLGFNICFSATRAKENLRFCGMMVCQIGPFSDNCEFQIRPIYDGFLAKNGTFEFYPYNMKVSRKLFGDFVLVRDMGF